MRITKLPNGNLLLDGRRWVELEQACKLKGIGKKSVQNNPYLQPLNGLPEDGREWQGRKKWKVETILEWLEKSNAEMKETWEKKILKRTTERFNLSA